jgi:hypothetical protein
LACPYAKQSTAGIVHQALLESAKEKRVELTWIDLVFASNVPSISLTCYEAIQKDDRSQPREVDSTFYW